MNQLKTFILFLFFTSITFAQSGSVNDTIIASQYFRKADSLLNDRKLDSAIIYFKKALSIYEKAKAWEKVAGCYNELAEGQYEKSDYEESLKNAQNALKINNNYLDENNLEKAYSLDIIARKIELVDLDFNKALDYYKKSLKIKENNINVKSTSLRKSYANLVSIYSNLGEYSLALEYIEKTVAIDTTNIKNLLERSQLSSKLANLYLELGNWDDSLEYLKKLHEVLEKKYDQSNEIYADIYHKIGVLYIEKRDYNQALKYLEKSEKILKSKSAIIPSSFYTSMGNIYNDLGLSEQALTYHHKSLEIARLTFGETSLRVIINYYNIANAYISKEEYDSGLEYLNKTLVLGEKILGKDHVELTRTHQLMATVYRKKKDFIKAESLLDKVLKICRIPLGKNHPRIALLYYQYGDLWSDQNQFDKAISYFNKSIEIRKLVFGEKSAPVSYAYKAIGDNFLLNKEYDKAIDFFNKSIKSNIITNELNHMDIEKTYDSSLFLSSSLGMASTFLKRYYDLGDIDDLKKARIHYKNIDNFIDPMNRKIINTKDKLSYYSELNNFYLDAIKLCLSEFDEEQDLKSVYEAFNYSEKSKSNTLKTLLNSNKAKEYSGISNELITLEKNIRIDKAFYQSNINKQLSNKQIDSTKLSDYESQLFGISRKQDSLTEVLEKNYPNYYELKYQDKVISVAEIQQKLDDKTTLLEFFTGDGITYAFTISKNKMSVRKVPTPKLEEQLNRFHSSITENVKEHKAISYQLYQLLIAPLRDELIGTQLIIVPDGRLWHLNFDLLHTHQDSSNNPKTWPYLLKEYAISYANSATLLFRDPMDKNSEFVSEDLKECLAFSFSGDSNPSDTRMVSLNTLRSSSIDLPGTRDEIKAIANIVDGQYFYGANATEQNFKKFAGDYNVLHLAVHGDVDNERPENSKLYFTKSKDTLEDNYLYSHELFALDIPAELAVLSACNTGTGKIAKGEGIMSLGTAFQYAGTKSLVLTNWEVSDEITPKIMEYFYTNLKEGKNKAAALQQAKLQFLATTNAETNHPYYWGGFYLLGDVAPIQFQDTNYSYWILGISIVAMTLLGFFWNRRKKII